MTRPKEKDYTSQVAYTRALEAYCDSLPQLTQQEPLTDEEIEYEIHQANIDFYNVEWHDFVKFARAIEAAHNIKENT